MHTVPLINVNIASTLPSPIIEGASVNLTCIVEMAELVESDLDLFDLEVILYRNESIPLDLSISDHEAEINGTALIHYTHHIVSFNLNDSGNYSCVATARPRLPFVRFINDTNVSSGVLNVTTGNLIVLRIGSYLVLILLSLGVYLKSSGKIYTNNGSTIPISEIGEGDDALLCFTDLRECCQNNLTLGDTSLGDWFYPNGSKVRRYLPDHGFYRSRDQSVVRLHWRKNATVTALIGQFCCKIPDATRNLITICINVINSTNLSSSGLVSREEHCKPTSTVIEQSITTIRFMII